MQFATEQKIRIFSAIALAATFGPLFIFHIWHHIGTKLIILISNFLMIVAWILVMFRLEIFFFSFSQLISRFFILFLNEKLQTFHNYCRPNFHFFISFFLLFYFCSQCKLFDCGCGTCSWRNCHWDFTFIDSVVYKWHCCRQSKTNVSFDYAIAIYFRNSFTIHSE